MRELAINGGKPIREKEWPEWPVHNKKEVEAIVEVTKSGIWSWGVGGYGLNYKEREADGDIEFGKRFAQFIGSRYATAAANGTVTLQLALEALDIGFGDEVIVPGITWQATATAVLDVNAIPILVDIEPETYCIDPNKIEDAITSRTRVIIPVHLHGSTADMDSIMKIAKKHNLKVIEDCAQSHGSRWRNQGVGAIGDIGSFSFQRGKVMTSGEGGALTTNSEDFLYRLYSLKHCGRLYRDDAGVYHGEHIQSGNYRITEFQTAILLCQLDRLKSHIDLKDNNAQYLNSLISEIDGIRPFLRRKQVTRQSYFNFGFRYDTEAFKGVPVNKFRRALSAEIRLPVGGTCEPLNNCSLYQPHTKRRYHISDEYWSAIDPRRFILPVAEKAHSKESVIMHHPFLLGTRKDMRDISDAIVKIKENIEELVNMEVN